MQKAAVTLKCLGRRLTKIDVGWYMLCNGTLVDFMELLGRLIVVAATLWWLGSVSIH
jgi:hypothetical protein